jgi:hypothetical protein
MYWEPHYLVVASRLIMEYFSSVVNNNIYSIWRKQALLAIIRDEIQHREATESDD